MIKRTINKAFGLLGYQMQKIKPVVEVNPHVGVGEFNMFPALERCVARGLNVNTVIDVGASNGAWSFECMKQLPNANYLLFEAQRDIYLNALNFFAQEHKNAEYILAAAGHREGTIYFQNEDAWGGLASDTPFTDFCIEVPVVRVGTEVTKRNLPGPYLIKLDTHGFEIPILEGALELFGDTALFVIEAYNYQVTSESLRFYELCAWFDKKGFYPIEMVDLMLRKYDQSLWQMDIFFVPKNRKEFTYVAYE